MSTTLSTLRDRTRRYLDESTAGRWTDANVNAYINEGIRFLQSELDRANPDYFLRVCTFSASANSYQAALPSTIYGHRIRNVQFYENTLSAVGNPYRVQPGQLEWIYENLDYSGQPAVYQTMAGYILWAPLLQYDSTFRFVYGKKEADLSADTDTLDAISDEYTDIISIYAAILAKESKEIPTGGLRAILERRLMHMANDSQPIDPFIIPQVQIDE